MNRRGAWSFLDNSYQRIFAQLVQNNRVILDKALIYDNYSSVVARTATAGVHSLPALCARVRIFRLSDFWAHPGPILQITAATAFVVLFPMMKKAIHPLKAASV